ncbi:MAG: S8 family serine peptidase [Aphanocapsa sp. GSE-SYN-MK-11-07L]|jgi:subtilisin family serine protease|nr:S8 family serine peptidase [Aphanocapsa sp. GSE-SYN-MK-11-07L]
MTNPNNLSARAIQTTGRYLVLLPRGQANAGIMSLRNSTGTSEIDDSAVSNIGVAVVALDPDQLQSLNAAVAGPEPILAAEPEQIMYAIATSAIGTVAPEQQLTTAAFSDGATTWGLQATKVFSSQYTGAGVKVAVLDTGLDLNHPDFSGRNITHTSFITGESVQDLQGHGTHCIGTSCGPLSPPDPSSPMRYGVAHNAEIFVGKVLSNEGSGADGGILAGIDWAISNGCQIISMSLGAPTRLGTPYSPIYEEVAKRALSQGTLIIAAAGNESSRPGFSNPVGRPANCPSIMAVAALDGQLQIAAFSNSSMNPEGGGIDITGPGVAVYSTWSTDALTVSPPNGLGPSRYQTIAGTSMATPHVAGIAALYAEATGTRGMELWAVLMQNAQRLPLPSVDVGIGLVQAPV